jgi:K+-sensing histidine kinase KdpD
VTVGLEQDQEFILITVDDEGSGVAPDMSKTYSKNFPKGKKSGKAGLGLYFAALQLNVGVALSAMNLVRKAVLDFGFACLSQFRWINKL